MSQQLLLCAAACLAEVPTRKSIACL